MDQLERGSTEIAISAVSGTYNRLDLLQRMVASVRQSVGSLPYEIVLVDGGSTDGTLEWCKSQADVVLVEQGELLGAIKAFNAGFEVARGHYVAILNDDITVDGSTLARAYNYLEHNPEIGMVAFGQRYQRRESPDKPQVARAFGYAYGQCCMVRHWLGQWAGWWGNEGMKTYGGDTRLGLRLWEMGWPVVPLAGCSVTDYEHQDELREINSDSPWRAARAKGELHPALHIFNRHWQDRLPSPDQHISAVVNRVLQKALKGSLRFLRFKAMYRASDPPRTALTQEMANYGEVLQINQAKELRQHGANYQQRILAIIEEFKPDLVMFQAQRPGNLEAQTVRQIRGRWPWVFTTNFDGDTHYPLTNWHFDIARAVHLQLVVSPSLFPQYAAHGIGVAYWPISTEREFLEAQRENPPTGPDVVFLGSYYGMEFLPEAIMRGEAVEALAQSGLGFELYGVGWEKLGLKAGYTLEQRTDNAQIYMRAKMALSISQTAELWGYTSNRLYNICATGCPALVQRFAGMEDTGFVDSQTCIAWDSIEEMLDKAHYYLAHEEEREAIGAAGRELVHNRHTRAHRVESLFAIIEGLKGDKEGC